VANWAAIRQIDWLTEIEISHDWFPYRGIEASGLVGPSQGLKMPRISPPQPMRVSVRRGQAMKGPSGNGSGKFKIAQMDMGGWVRVFCEDMDHAPSDLPTYLSQALSDWFRAHANLSLQFVVPITRDGDTVELHAYYHMHLLPPLQGPKPVRQKGA